MGLVLKARGYAKEAVHIGYAGFGFIRCCIATSYNEELGKLYEKPYKCFGYQYTQAEIDRYNEVCNDDLDILLNHSDYDGTLSSADCKKIFAVLHGLDFKYPSNVRQDQNDTYYLLKDMIEYCAKTGHALHFS